MFQRIELNPGWPWIEKVRVMPGVKVGDTIYTAAMMPPLFGTPIRSYQKTCRFG